MILMYGEQIEKLRGISRRRRRMEALSRRAATLYLLESW